MNRKIALFLIGVGLIVACTSPKEAKTLEMGETSAQAVMQAYFDIKDALITSDPEASLEASNQLLSALTDADDALSADLKASVEAMLNSDDIDGQRIHFSSLTEDILAVIEAGILDKTIYKQYCPMAFDNQGAHWYSLEEEVVNPYFGDAMLHCGSVQEEY